MFKTRLLSAIILMIVTIFVLVSGGNILLFTLLATSLIGLYELYKASKNEKNILGITGYIITIIYYMNLFFKLNLEMPIFIFAIIALMSAFVFTYPKYEIKDIAITFFGIIYVSYMMSFVYQIRNIEEGIYLVWLIFICSWGCDTSAYCVGMTMGKHKLAPVLSPKKSIEGAVGGILGASLLGLIFALITKTNITQIMIISACGAVISQIGDLAASAIKRNYKIKDYGKLIPGHGGILDRFDSVIFVAPIIYYLLTIL